MNNNIFFNLDKEKNIKLLAINRFTRLKFKRKYGYYINRKNLHIEMRDITDDNKLCRFASYKRPFFKYKEIIYRPINFYAHSNKINRWR